MKAIIVRAFGNADALEIKPAHPEPAPGTDEILIRTRMVAVNYADIHARRGANKSKSTPFIPGTEAVGEVIALGEAVTSFQIGDRVTAYTEGGSYAEVVRAKAILSYPIPDGVSNESAACITSGITAYNALHRVGQITEDDRILIHSSAGGVGLLAVQIAKQAGAKQVIGTVGSDEKKAVVESMGADAVINYHDEDYHESIMNLTEGHGADLILDSRGGEAMEATLFDLADYGRLVVFGQSSGVPARFPSDVFYKRNQQILGYTSSHIRKTRPADLRTTATALLDLLATGAIRNLIGTTFDLDQAGDAHRLLESRASVGKVLLRV